MKVTGKIEVIDQTKTFGEKGFKKRDLVVTTDEQYPQTILIEFIQDKCDLLDSYRVGQDVTVSVNLCGREWVNPQGETKYFNSIQGWRIEASQASAGSETPPAFETMSAPISSDNEPDDLPF
jgi:hypothetical protein